MVLAHNINEGLRTQDVLISEDVTFDTMLLAPNTLEGLTNSGFHKPSPIQLHGIPLGKCGFDLLLEAKSGTGKTAVFTVIALEKLDLLKGLQAIILAPTREIAVQISDVIKQIGSSYKNLNVEVVIGGLPTHEDIAKFKKNVHILVGSPGRLRHLIQANHINVSAVRLLVLDEADKLMDKSFQADINYIFSVLPKEKQVIMNSATYPENLKSIMKKYVQNAQHICPDSSAILMGIKQLVITVKSNTNIVRQTQNRFEELRKILSKKQFKQCLIFCNYQVRVRDLCKMLLREKWPAEQLHGQQEQTDRLDALKTLQEYKCRILISTDLAARGIDASNVDLVINFEPPHEWQIYLHRIGRAGRFGSYGTAITILSEGQEELIFKKMIKSINSSLDLKNLWDEEKFDLDEYDSSLETSIEQEIQTDVANDELLNILIHGNTNCVKETESFETLCNSFEKAKEVTIECFNDLLTCCESHTINNNDASYNKSNNECFTSTINAQNIGILKLNTNNELEDNSIKTRQKINSTNESQVFKKSVEEICEINNNPVKQLKSPNKTNLNTTNSLKKGTKVYDEICDLEFNESHLYKALLDAGLPTSFGSSKGQMRQPKNILHPACFSDNKNIDSIQESEDIKHKGTGNKNKHPLTGKKTSKFERKSLTCLNSGCESGFTRRQTQNNKLQSIGTKTEIRFESDKETHLNSVCESLFTTRQIKHPSTRSKIYSKLESDEETHWYSECESNFTRTWNKSKELKALYNKDMQKNNNKIYKQKFHDIVDSKNYSHEDKMNYDSHIKYTIWYNQLKAHIGQVQMSLYIDEFSKL